jgi:hypothetical protein
MAKSTTPIGHYNTVEEAEDVLRRQDFKWDKRRDTISEAMWYKGGVEVALWRKNSGTLLFNIRAERKVLAEKDLRASVSRYCMIYQAKNGMWYLELANAEYGDRSDATTYGPFSSDDKADAYISNFSNPGSLIMESKKLPVPTKSPNGMRVVKP